MVKPALTFYVSLSPEKVLAMVSEAIGHERYFCWDLSGVFSEKTFLGNIKGSEFRVRKKHWFSNGLTMLMYGHVSPHAEGSQVAIEFKTYWLVRLIMIVTMVLTIGLPLAFVSYTGIDWFEIESSKEWAYVIIGYGANVLFLVGIFALAWVLGKRDRVPLQAFILQLFWEQLSENDKAQLRMYVDTSHE